jgi:hypothetical protein
MPLLFLFNEKFEQPIFGSNYLELQLKPFYNLIPGITTVKLWFTSGGCQKFLKCFIHVDILIFSICFYSFILL